MADASRSSFIEVRDDAGTTYKYIGYLTKKPIHPEWPTFAKPRRRFFTLEESVLNWAVEQNGERRGHMSLDGGVKLERTTDALSLTRATETLTLRADDDGGAQVLDGWATALRTAIDQCNSRDKSVDEQVSALQHRAEGAERSLSEARAEAIENSTDASAKLANLEAQLAAASAREKELAEANATLQVQVDELKAAAAAATPDVSDAAKEGGGGGGGGGSAAAASGEEAEEAAKADVARLWRHSVRSVQLAADPAGPESDGTDLKTWTAAAWLASLCVARAVAKSVCGEGVAAEGELARVQELSATLTSEELVAEHLIANGAVQALAAPILASLKKFAAQAKGGSGGGGGASASGGSSKFAVVEPDAGFELKYAGLSTFFGGLEGQIGAPDVYVWDALMREHCKSADSHDAFTTGNYAVTTTPAKEWGFVVEPEKASAYGVSEWPIEVREGERERGWKPRTPIRLADLQKELERFNRRLADVGQEDGLSTEEGVAARLYTGPMFVKYNDLLRKFGPALPTCKGNKYVTTTHAINSAILKASKITQCKKVYRGVAGGRLPHSFEKPNEHGVRGGVENSFMSTTYDRSVALKYASVPGKPGLIFEMSMGMVDRGADLETLSQYPSERECLFAPLTGLEVVRTRVDGSVLIVEARLSINLNSLTIDQVINKRRKLVKDVANGLKAEVLDALDHAIRDNAVLSKQRAADPNGWAAWMEMRGSLAEAIVIEGVHDAQPAEWFNRDEAFKHAMQTAVNVKIALAQPTPGEIELDDCKVLRKLPAMLAQYRQPGGARGLTSLALKQCDVLTILPDLRSMPGLQKNLIDMRRVTPRDKPVQAAVSAWKESGYASSAGHHDIDTAVLEGAIATPSRANSTHSTPVSRQSSRASTPRSP